jgi:ethanolamine utilization microcompartment shell protein EutS
MEKALILSFVILLKGQMATAGTEMPVTPLYTRFRTPVSSRFHNPGGYIYGVDRSTLFSLKKPLGSTANYTDYLPLTGGTITGSLAGTSASFSGSMGIGISSPLEKLSVSVATDNVFNVGYMSALHAVSIYSSTDLGDYHKLMIDGKDLILNARSGGNISVGTVTPNIGGWPSSTRVITIKGKTNAGVIELASASGDVDGVRIGSVDFVNEANTNGKELATIDAFSSGSTAGHRGGSLIFLTKPDNGAVARRMVINDAGYVGIGTSTPSEMLSVNGNIAAKKMIVTRLGWSDYVFDEEYKLRSLSSLEAFIKQNKHLPEVPSTNEVEAQGLNLGDNQALLLKKIEELTLYLILQDKKIDLVIAENKKLKRLIENNK